MQRPEQAAETEPEPAAEAVVAGSGRPGLLPGRRGDGAGVAAAALGDAEGPGEFVAARAAPAPPSSAATATPARMYGRRDQDRRFIGPIGRVDPAGPISITSSGSAGSGRSAGIHQA